jgi:hypothetical protein
VVLDDHGERRQDGEGEAGPEHGPGGRAADGAAEHARKPAEERRQQEELQHAEVRRAWYAGLRAHGRVERRARRGRRVGRGMRGTTAATNSAAAAT